MKMIFFLFVLAFVFVPSATQAQVSGWQIEQNNLVSWFKSGHQWHFWHH